MAQDINVGDNLIILGNGGHAKLIADLILLDNEFIVHGFIDDSELIHYRGIGTLGNDSILPELFVYGIKLAFIGIGAIANTKLRQVLFNKLKSIGYILPNIIHPSAVIGYDVQMGEGNFIGPGVIINSHTKLGNNCIINSGSIIEHDCVLSNHVHLAPRVTLCGGVKIGENSFIGTCAVVLETCSIADSSIVGASSLVNKDITMANQTGFGIPFKVR
jgi:sugar O-acyltransferase (sialic acid O-acetyltransferase NeuD family)